MLDIDRVNMSDIRKLFEKLTQRKEHPVGQGEEQQSKRQCNGESVDDMNEHSVQTPPEYGIKMGNEHPVGAVRSDVATLGGVRYDAHDSRSDHPVVDHSNHPVGGVMSNEIDVGRVMYDAQTGRNDHSVDTREYTLEGGPVKSVRLDERGMWGRGFGIVKEETPCNII